MNIFTTFLFLVLLSLNATAKECPPTPDDIKKAINNHILQIRADEYCKARTVKTEGNITMAVYTAEGACDGLSKTASPGSCSNNWVRYMVGSTNGKIIGPIKIGGKGDLSDRAIHIKENTVELTGLSIGPDDALCCPSVVSTKKFKFSPEGFSEIKP